MSPKEVIACAVGVAGIAVVFSPQIGSRFDDVAVCIARAAAVGKAAIEYSADNDGRMVLAAYSPSVTFQTANIKTWPELLLPYHDQWTNYRCVASPYTCEPFVSRDDNGFRPYGRPAQEHVFAMNSSRGMNGWYLSPMVRFADGRTGPAPISMAQIAEPGATLFALESCARGTQSQPGRAGWYLTSPPCRYDSKGNDTFPLPTGSTLLWSYWWGPPSRWRGDNGHSWTWHRSETYGDREQVSISVFADGHVQPVPMPQLVAGCDVRRLWAGRILDSAAYKWDLQ